MANGNVVPAQDVHYTLMDLNSNKIAENKVQNPAGVDVELNVEPGVYFLSAEQPSTRYFGSLTLSVNAPAVETGVYSQSVEEEEAADDDDDDRKRFFLLSDNGLSEITEAQLNELMATPAAAPAPAPAVAPVEPVYPAYPAYPAAQGGRWGTWLGLGALATGIVAMFFPEKESASANNR